MADLDDLAARVVARAGDDEQLEAIVVRDRSTEVVAYGGEVESLTVAESAGIGVRVVRDGRQGFAYAGTLDDDVVAELVDEARTNAGFGDPDEHNGLATPDGVPVPDIDPWDSRLADVPTDRKVEIALELERAVKAADPRITVVEEAGYGDGMVEAVLVTSTGMSSTWRRTSAGVSAYALAGEDGDTQTGFGFSVGRHPDDCSVAEAAADTAERATRMLGATKPPTHRLTVVLDPWVASQFVGIIGGTLNGESVLKGRSLFADRVGEQVAAPVFELVDDPTDERAYTASANDGEGLASRRNALISGGVLQGFVHNTYTGRRSGGASTGNAVRGYSSVPGVGCRALTVTPGTQTQDELVAGIDDGLLVQSVTGLHSGVNPISGDFSTGAEGVRIRNGALAEPVRELTIASTLQRMLLDVRAIGSDLTWLPMTAAGVSIVIDDVTMSGT